VTETQASPKPKMTDQDGRLVCNRGFAAMLDGRNNRLFFPWEQMFFLMQIIFIVLPSNMAAMQNLYLPYKGFRFSSHNN